MLKADGHIGMIPNGGWDAMRFQEDRRYRASDCGGSGWVRCNLCNGSGRDPTSHMGGVCPICLYYRPQFPGHIPCAACDAGRLARAA